MLAARVALFNNGGWGGGCNEHPSPGLDCRRRINLRIHAFAFVDISGGVPHGLVQPQSPAFKLHFMQLLRH